MCLIAGWLSAAGCQEAAVTAVSGTKTTAVSGGSTEPARSSTPTIEAGIVLADRAGYFCLPIEQIGLPPDAEIVSLKSSCECVQPKLVQYLVDRQRLSQAILLEYVAEFSSSDVAGEDEASNVRPINLSVIVTVGLADGTKPDFTVNLVHTVLHQKELTHSAAEDWSRNPQVGYTISSRELSSSCFIDRFIDEKSP